jgi:Zn-dependent M28 family amino/carboxypeptidase
VILSSQAGERLRYERGASEQPLGFEGWLNLEAAEQVASMAGLDFSTLLETARSEEFRPIATGVNVTATVRSSRRRIEVANVAGLLPGSDPRLADEVVVFSAHYDHLGIGPAVDGDSIYNGTYDNASGTALLLVLGEAFAQLPQRPARSILFLALTAEEAGLLGSGYYTDNPLLPLSRTVANLNIDGAGVWGRTEDIVVLGAEYSSLESIAAAAAAAEDLRLAGDRAPELGFIFRSGQFSFMRAGVPVAFVQHGLDYRGRLPGWGKQVMERYNSGQYHQPGDEYRPDFDYAGAVQQARVAFRIGFTVANGPDRPMWKEGDGPRW